MANCTCELEGKNVGSRKHGQSNSREISREAERKRHAASSMSIPSYTATQPDMEAMFAGTQNEILGGMKQVVGESIDEKLIPIVATLKQHAEMFNEVKTKLLDHDTAKTT